MAAIAQACQASITDSNFRLQLPVVIFKLIWRINILSISSEIALKRMPKELTDDKSTLAQVMTWCCQATSHYLNQSWAASMLPYGITRPQFVQYFLLGLVKVAPFDDIVSGWTGRRVAFITGDPSFDFRCSIVDFLSSTVVEFLCSTDFLFRVLLFISPCDCLVATDFEVCLTDAAAELAFDSLFLLLTDCVGAATVELALGLLLV